MSLDLARLQFAITTIYQGKRCLPLDPFDRVRALRGGRLT